MLVELELVKLAAAALIIACAAIVDYKARELPNYYPLVLFIVGLLGFYVYYAGGLLVVPMLISTVGFLAFYAFGIGSAYVQGKMGKHFFGGGDAKMLMALAVAQPMPPIWSLDHHVVFWTPAFPLTVFINAVVIALPLYLVFRRRGVPFMVPVALSFVASVLWGDVFINIIAALIH